MKKKPLILVIVAVVLLVLIGGSILLANFLKPTEAGLYDGDKKIENPDILSIDGEQVDFADFRYAFLGMTQQVVAAEPEFFEDEENFDGMMESVEDFMKMEILTAKLYKEYSIALTDEELASVDFSLQQERAKYASEGDYQKALNISGLTEEMLKDMIAEQILQPKLLDVLLGDEVRDANIRAKHILIKKEEDKSATESDSNSNSEPNVALDLLNAEHRKLAEELAVRAKDGEDFDALVEEYSQDGMPEEGYYFVEGEMVEEFYTATMDLDIDEVSGVVETDFGYHVILRLEPDDEHLAALPATTINQQVVINPDLSQMLNDIFEEMLEELEVSYGVDYDKVTIDSIK